jgi:hypothetical protein
MGPEIGKYVADQIASLVIVAAIVGAILAAALIFGIPLLWEFVKPFLHQVTA